MRVEGKVAFKADPAAVYDVFTSAEALRRATPGLQNMAPVGDDKYEAVIKLGVAGISGTYTGTIALTEQRPPEHYELKITGKGSSGELKGTGAFDFAADAGGTQVSYQWDVEVFGLVAGVGQRVLGGVAKMLIGQFFKAMEQELAGQS